MANIKTSEKKSGRKVIILPRSNDTYKEKFAFANGQRIPFETPVLLNDTQIKLLKQQREPIKGKNTDTVYDVMDRLQVDQKKAAQILAEKQRSGLDTSINWKQKYIVQEV